jgi:tRNA modification GTPase
LGEGQGEGRRSIESAAQSAADLQRRQSQVQMLCLDATRPLDEWEREEIVRFPAAGRIVVLTKCDEPRRTDCAQIAIETSSRTGQGIDTLREKLRLAALAAGGAVGDVVAGTAMRCCQSLRAAAECLRQARQLAAAAQEELSAAEIRLALEELGKVVGAVYTDDVLDRIFSRFCVGK